MFTSLRFTHFALFTGLLVGLTTGVAAHFSRTELSPALVSRAFTQVEPAESEAITQVEPAESKDKNKDTQAAYSSVPLEQFTQSGRSLTGQRPSAIVAQLFGATEGLSPLGLEQMEIRYAESGEAIALLTQTGRQDDSVNGVRYRVELQPQPSDIGSQWQVTWVGQQFKCQPQRGQQDWATALCL